MAEDYLHNSTYAFSENKVVAHVELEGLESEWYLVKLFQNLFSSKSPSLSVSGTEQALVRKRNGGSSAVEFEGNTSVSGSSSNSSNSSNVGNEFPDLNGTAIATVGNSLSIQGANLKGVQGRVPGYRMKVGGNKSVGIYIKDGYYLPDKGGYVDLSSFWGSKDVSGGKIQYFNPAKTSVFDADLTFKLQKGSRLMGGAANLITFYQMWSDSNQLAEGLLSESQYNYRTFYNVASFVPGAGLYFGMAGAVTEPAAELGSKTSSKITEYYRSNPTSFFNWVNGTNH